MKKNNQNKKITNYCLPAITIILILFTAFTLIKDADVAVGATTTTTVHRTTTTTTTCSCKGCNPTSGACESRTTTHCPCTNSCTISSDCKTTTTTTTTIKCTCKACSASNWCSDRQYTGTGCPCRDTCSDHCECGATLERCKTATGATNCICSVRYSDTPCADTCRIDADCSTSDYSPPPTSHYVPPTSPSPTSPSPTSPPPTSPPPTCQINSFTINEKDNSEQNPLIVWVNASLRGHFSVNYCTSCEVISNDIWSNTYDPLPSSGDVTEQFKINTADNYSYTLECIGDPDDPNDSDEDFLSLKAVQAVNLPWWREIIPYLGGFLRGL